MLRYLVPTLVDEGQRVHGLWGQHIRQMNRTKLVLVSTLSQGVLPPEKKGRPE